MTLRIPLTLRFAVLLVAGLLLGTPLTAASALTGPVVGASDAYQPSMIVAVELRVRRHAVAGADVMARTLVRSDVGATDGRTALAEGRVRFSVDGRALATREIDPGGHAQYRIRAAELHPGDNEVRADYLPPRDSAFQPGSDSAHVQVGAAGDPASDDDPEVTNLSSAGTTGLGGLLPSTGGVWLGLLFLALGALVAGGWLVHRSGRRA